MLVIEKLNVIGLIFPFSVLSQKYNVPKSKVSVELYTPILPYTFAFASLLTTPDATEGAVFESLSALSPYIEVTISTLHSWAVKPIEPLTFNVAVLIEYTPIAIAQILKQIVTKFSKMLNFLFFILFPFYFLE